MSRSAVVFGATGLVGRRVTEGLIAHSAWDRVVVIVRRPTGLVNPKLTEVIADFNALGASAAAMQVDDVFACLGTTIKVAGSKERFRQVDHDFTLAGATLARGQGATRIALVSSVGADAGSANFYLRVKGETERDVQAIGYGSVILARPSGLVGERSERRPGERIGVALAGALSFAMVGGLRRYRPIGADAVARAMIAATLAGEPGARVLEHDALTALAQGLTSP